MLLCCWLGPGEFWYENQLNSQVPRLTRCLTYTHVNCTPTISQGSPLTVVSTCSQRGSQGDLTLGAGSHPNLPAALGGSNAALQQAALGTSPMNRCTNCFQARVNGCWAILVAVGTGLTINLAL